MNQSLPERYRPALLTTSVLLLIVGLAGFGTVLVMARSASGLATMDLPLFRDLLHHRSPAWTIFFAVVTTLASPPWLATIVIVSAALWAFFSRYWWRPVLWVGTMAVSAAVSNIIKHLVGRHRPPIADMATGANHSYSFPSGHALGISVFLFTLGYLLLSRRFSRNRLLGWVLGTVVVIFLIGVSRMYLGYHWFTDVSAAVFLAMAFLGVVILVDLFRPKRADKPFRKSSKPATEPRAESEHPEDRPAQH